MIWFHTRALCFFSDAQHQTTHVHKRQIPRNSNNPLQHTNFNQKKMKKPCNSLLSLLTSLLDTLFLPTWHLHLTEDHNHNHNTTPHPSDHAFLPNDLLLHIFQFLPDSVLFTQCRGISRQFHRQLLVTPLSLRLCGSMGEVIRDFTSDRFFTHITHLNLSHNYNRVGNRGAEWLASCHSLIHVKSLNLHCCAIRCEGVKSITSHSSHLLQLTDLDLSDNFLRDEGVCWIAESSMTQLTCLNLEWNEIEDLGACRLAGVKLSQLSSVKLNYNKIGGLGRVEVFRRGWVEMNDWNKLYYD